MAQDAERQAQHQPKLTQPNQRLTHADPVLTQRHPQLQTNPSAACATEGLGKQPQSHPSAEVTTGAASQLAYAPPHTALSQHAHTLHRIDATVTAGPCMHGTKRSAADMDADNASSAVSHKRKQQGQSISHRAEPTLPGQQGHLSSHSTPPAGQQGQEWIHSTQLESQARHRQKPIHGRTPAMTAQGQEQIYGTGGTLPMQQMPESSHDTQPALLGMQDPSQQDLPLVPSSSLCQEDGDVDGSCLNDTVGAIFIDASGA